MNIKVTVLRFRFQLYNHSAMHAAAFRGHGHPAPTVFLLAFTALAASPNNTRFKSLSFLIAQVYNTFKYRGSVIAGEGSKPEILSRTAQSTAALARLKPVWNDRSISFSSKIRLMHSLVTSIFLSVCESWTLTAELQRRRQAMEMRCYRKILRISYTDYVTNEEVRAKIQQAIGPHE